MYWELWDVESRNLIEDFATEEEALQAISEILAVNRPDYVDFLALAAMYDEGESREVELPPALRGEELRARLAESAHSLAADDALHSAHDRIRRWLVEEKWGIQDIPDAKSDFNIMVTLQTDQRVNIFQRNDHLDHVTIALHVVFDDSDQPEPERLPENILNDIGCEIERDVLMMGLEFACPGVTPMQIRLATFLYFDALSKDALIQRILLVLRALSLSARTYAREAQRAGRLPDSLVKGLRLVHRSEDIPVGSGPLTAAS